MARLTRERKPGPSVPDLEPHPLDPRAWHPPLLGFDKSVCVGGGEGAVSVPGLTKPREAGLPKNARKS